MESIKNIPVHVDEKRVTSLLRCGSDHQDEMRKLIKTGLKACIPLFDPFIAFEKVKISENTGKSVVLENSAVFHGEYISEKLSGCQYIVACVLTVGPAIERYISHCFKEDKALEAMTADALSVAALENLGNHLWNILAGRINGTDFGMTQRLSPGDGDWKIEEQRAVFSCFTQSTAPITLTKSGAMTPLKSVSAVYGFGKGIGISKIDHICKECSLKNCPYRAPEEYEIMVYSQKEKKIIRVKDGVNLLEALQENQCIGGFPCAGNGTCGKCRVQVLSGDSPVTDADRAHLSPEEIADGFRISCRQTVQAPMEISVLNLPEDFSILTQGINRKISPDSPVQKKHLVLKENTAPDQRSYFRCISDGLCVKNLSAGPLILRNLSEKIGTAGSDFTAVTYENTLLDIENGNTEKSRFGAAVDIGTTTVVCYLVELLSGKIIGSEARANSQRAYGADVLSRIDFTNKHADGSETLMRLIIDEINSMMDCLCDRTGVNRQNIYEMTATGNTVMLHFLLGLPAKSIAVAPFTPVFTEAAVFNAAEIGIRINGMVSVMPGIAGYVGGDITAGILACGMPESADNSLLIDLGTNGEMAVCKQHNITACAVAAGPAFEGGNIKCGVGGVNGAIYSVDLDSPSVYKTIGDAEPCGICGSGVLDAVSELLKNGVVDSTGRFAEKESIKRADLRDRLAGDGGEKSFILAESSRSGQPIVITQKDIREIQLAKAAVAAGIRVLLHENGLSPTNLDKIYIAGGFGNYMSQKSALAIGLLPPEFKGKIVSAGNTAGAGARLYLLSKKCREKTEKIARNASYIELSAKPEFQEHFIDAIAFD